MRVLPVGLKPRLYKIGGGAWACASSIELKLVFSFNKEPVIVMGAGLSPADAYNRWNLNMTPFRRKIKF